MKVYSIICLLFLCSLPTLAQPRGPRPFASLSIGPGVTFQRNIRFDNLKDDSDKPTIISAIPFARFKLGPVSLAGKGIALALPSGFLRTSLLFNRLGSRYYGPDMDRRKDSWAFGFSLAIPMIRLSFSKDIQSRSEGSQTSINIGRMLFLGPIMLRPGISFTYSDSEYINYYYGVRDHEISANRHKYGPGGSWSYGLNLMSSYAFNESYSITTIFSHRILGPRVRQSPTTRTDRVNSFILGLSMKVF